MAAAAAVAAAVDALLAVAAEAAVGLRGSTVYAAASAPGAEIHLRVPSREAASEARSMRSHSTQRKESPPAS